MLIQPMLYRQRRHRHQRAAFYAATGVGGGGGVAKGEEVKALLTQ